MGAKGVAERYAAVSYDSTVSGSLGSPKARQGCFLMAYLNLDNPDSDSGIIPVS